jgi:protease PrsW
VIGRPASPYPSRPRMPAATPGFHRHHGLGAAILIVAAMLVAMLVSALVGTLLQASGAILYLIALAISVVMAVFTYGFVALFDLINHDPAQRRVVLVIASVALAVMISLWMMLVPALFTLTNLPGFLLNLPTSAFALWVLRRIQRNRKEPWWLVLVAIAWGVIVASNFAMVTESAYSALLGPHLIPGPAVSFAQSFSAGLFEELGKGVAVVVLFVLCRDRFDGVVGGIVTGAAVGLGFNFLESIGYSATGGQLFFQWWARQVVGLFFGHVTFTALIGAGLGVARQQPERWRQAVCVVSGFAAAVAAHFLWDSFAMTRLMWDSDSEVLSTFVFLPINTLLIEGPFTLMLVALLILGLRNEGNALRVELAAEAATAQGAVTTSEVGVLASPWRRFQVRWHALTRQGYASYRRVRRLQAAQLDLAMERWHRARQELDEPLAAEAHLRERVLKLRGPMARTA